MPSESFRKVPMRKAYLRDGAWYYTTLKGKEIFVKPERKTPAAARTQPVNPVGHNGGGVGTIFKRKITVLNIRCSSCLRYMTNLDTWGPDRCLAQFDAIVDRVLENFIKLNVVNKLKAIPAAVALSVSTGSASPRVIVAHALRESIREALWPEKSACLSVDGAIVTACDNAYIKGAYIAAFTAMRTTKCPVICYEIDSIPCDDPHKKQMSEWGVHFVPINVPRTAYRWQIWNKPRYILEALKSHDRVMWLDSDVFVQDNLTVPFETDEFFVASHGGYQTATNRNKPEVTQALRDRMTLVHRSWGPDMPCAGILACSAKHSDFIERWRDLCDYAIEKKLDRQVRFQDQGILQELVSCELQDGNWNNMKTSHSGTQQRIIAEGLYTPSHIIHYGGSVKPWTTWPDLDWGSPSALQL